MRRFVFGLGVLLVAFSGVGACASGADGGSKKSTGAATTGASETSGARSAEPAPAPTPDSPSAPPPSGRPSGAGPGASSKPASPKPCPRGDKHREVEAALAAIGGFGPVTVDGEQSEPDCAAIVKFQKRFGISPANGRASGTTADVARRISASRTAETRAKCKPAPSGMTACVDLTLQTMWIVRDGAVIWGPTVLRSGFKGYATPTGTYKIFYRNIKEWSNPYEVWMPYWQNFTGGIGFHETVTYLHNRGLGSHGCVNLLRADARELWSLIGKGTTVHTFGRRPGT